MYAYRNVNKQIYFFYFILFLNKLINKFKIQILKISVRFIISLMKLILNDTQLKAYSLGKSIVTIYI